MPSAFAWLSCSIAVVICQYAASVRADDAASNYLFAVLELGRSVPAYVNSATTDDPDMGFEVVLSDKQKSYLQQPSVAAALDRFDRATSRDYCVWSRYSDLSWSAADLNDRLHQLARVALLRARLHFESGEWIEGNRSVERVRIMARHMTLQARPFEHQCFMVENMANGTAAAYVLQLPQDALADLYKRHIRLGPFSPKANMLRSETKRIKMLAEGIDADKLTLEKVLEFIDPYLANETDEQRIRKMSHTDIADEVRGLASFLSEHSGLMEVAHSDAERQIAETYRRHSNTCRLVAGWRMPPLGDYRENAQGICRGVMVGAVIKQLQNDQPDFTTIEDPYGSKPFEYQTHVRGFTLVSELQHHSRIDFRFGSATTGSLDETGDRRTSSRR